MRRPRPARHRIPLLAFLALACAALAAACTGGGAPEPAATPEPAVTTATPAATATPEATATPTPAAYDFPTGPAVLVAADYVAPEDRVASTGAYIPSNGKPTLVFVDAIW
ncbi:MAG: hypothetical protein F4X25_12720 [Chloroflexi bacterium]|nr:hypothetical protein [Chloroflexota bacterium]